MTVSPIRPVALDRAVALLIKAGIHVDQTDRQRVALANAGLTRAERFLLPEAMRTVISELERLAATEPGSDEHVRLLRLFDRSFEL